MENEGKQTSQSNQIQQNNQSNQNEQNNQEKTFPNIFKPKNASDYLNIFESFEEKKYRIMSLFANVGIAEALLDGIADVKIANEIDKKRASFYKAVYPDTDMVCGDITDENIQKQLIIKAKEEKVNLIIATPPCQGMSLAGRREKHDVRNLLICHAISIIQAVKPDYVLLENVPEQLKTKIINENGEEQYIPDYIIEKLSGLYHINYRVVNMADYGVPQARRRAVFLITRKDKPHWDFPKTGKWVTLKEAIGDLPELVPLISDMDYDEFLKVFGDYEEKKKAGKACSKWHRPPIQKQRHVYIMEHTPTGKSAFDNEDKYKPRKADGSLIKGFRTCYKRQDWDRPAYTVTMSNGSISSQNNGHPGREKNGLYSDPRVLSILELFRVMTIPDDWNVPEGYSDNFIRQVIGEGIPPLFLRKMIENIRK